MKKILFIILLVNIVALTKAQRNVDLGIFGGTDYYMGDINPERLFYSPRYSIGPIFRINIDSRYSVRLHGIYASLSGSDADFEENITKRNSNVSFNTNLVNFAAQAEFNFFPYKTGEDKGNWTPYIFGGVGYSFIVSSSVEQSGIIPENHLTTPFGVGFKVNLSRRLSAGLEWSQVKTYNDRLDGVVSPLGDTKLYSNDWYSLVGLFITYKFFKFAADCPAYN